MKDSANDSERMKALVGRFGGRPDFSVFVGVGRLMEEGLRLGADGIVPSVGNLIPKSCRALWDSARRGHWAAASQHAARMSAVASVYQAGRDLDGSLCVLKAALSLQKVCERFMFPPLEPLSDTELVALAPRLSELQVIGGSAESPGAGAAANAAEKRSYPTP
jgi:4-hydroxy-tetrahydrodipicolinate synthase